MKRLFMGLILLLAVSCSTKYNYIDTGISNGVFEGSMLDYLRSDHYNWDSVVVMIERAELEPLFEGKDTDYKQITFFGPTNHSIRNWLMDDTLYRRADTVYTTIQDIPVDTCRSLILRHVIEGRYLTIDVPKGSIGTSEGEGQKDGMYINALGGNELWLYTVQSPYYGVEGAGPLTLYLMSMDFSASVPLACPDIQCDNGVVCSLDYSYQFGHI